MIGVALKGLAGRKLRAALTAMAIVLGVAMISGTYILTDTIKSAFGTVFTQVYKNTDVVITGKSAIGGNEHNNGTTPPAFPNPFCRRCRGFRGWRKRRAVYRTPPSSWGATARSYRSGAPQAWPSPCIRTATSASTR